MNNIAFTIFGKDIYWYGIIIAAALIIGVLLGVREAKRRGFRAEMVLDFMLIAIPVCIVFARLFYVIFATNPVTGINPYWVDPSRIIAIWEGGLAIYGAVIGGILSAFIFYKWRRVHIGDILDIAAPSIIIAQAIGRWGNFVNQEAFGPKVADASGQWFPYAVYIERLGEWHLATFFYESMWNLLVFIFLMLIRKKIKFRGGVFALYVALYGFGRFWIEQLRTDSLFVGQSTIRVSQLLGGIMFVLGIAYVIYMTVRKKEEIPYEGMYSTSWSPEQVAEFKANIKTIRAQEKADKSAKKAEAMLTKNDTAEDKVKRAQEKADKARQKLNGLESKISLAEIKAKDDRSEEKAETAKEKIKKAEEKIQRAEEKVEMAKEKAQDAEIKAKKAEQDALIRSAKAKKAEIKEEQAKAKAQKAAQKAAENAETPSNKEPLE